MLFIKGVSFNNDGKMNWKPDFFQAGEYEFTISASGGGQVKGSNNLMVESTDSSIHDKVKNTNRAPLLSKKLKIK